MACGRLAQLPARLRGDVLLEVGAIDALHHHIDGVGDLDDVAEAHDVLVAEVAEHVHLPHHLAEPLLVVPTRLKHFDREAARRVLFSDESGSASASTTVQFAPLPSIGPSWKRGSSSRDAAVGTSAGDCVTPASCSRAALTTCCHGVFGSCGIDRTGALPLAVRLWPGAPPPAGRRLARRLLPEYGGHRLRRKPLR